MSSAQPKHTSVTSLSWAEHYLTYHPTPKEQWEITQACPFMSTVIIIAPIRDDLEGSCHPAAGWLNLPVQQTKNEYKYEREAKT